MLEKRTICSIMKKDASKPTKRTSEQNDYRGKILNIFAQLPIFTYLHLFICAVKK